MPSPSAVEPALSRWETVAMASRITVQAPAPAEELSRHVEAVFGVFARVERDCTRFGTTSPLVRANRHPGRWHRVPPTLFEALREALAAHRMTGGLFDPRVHDDLVELGYDRTFTELDGSSSGATVSRRPLGSWRPRFVAGARLVNLGGRPADLGGIGKGLAIRDAARLLGHATDDFLIEAGGDLYAAGGPTPGGAWSVGVESPSGEERPAAVLEVRDFAVATSSVRIRQWRAGDAPVHHLIDPRNGRPGGGRLRSVTVVHPDPAHAEVWSKALFVCNPEGIAEAATSWGLPALWIDEAGAVAMSDPMRRFVTWVSR